MRMSREERNAYERARRLRNLDHERERSRARNRTFRERNHERYLALARSYYAADREALLPKMRERARKRNADHPEIAREYRKTNRAKRSEGHRDWLRRNPEANRIAAQKRRARERGAEGSGVTVAQWRQIKADYGHRCAYCARGETKLVMEHIDPLSKGGAHDPTNVAPACEDCNHSKHNKSLVFWLIARAA